MHNKYSVSDRKAITKSILDQYKCQSSSEFTIATYEIYSILYPVYAEHVEPLIYIEAQNEYRNDWIKNTVYSQDVVSLIADVDHLQKIVNAYRTVLDFLINDDTCSASYRMDSVDTIGETIWKELDRKYIFAKTYLQRLKYQESKNGI